MTTKRQRDQRYVEAGVMPPETKMSPEQVQRLVRQRSVKFADKRTSRLRDRGSQRRVAITEDAS
jgi:hypothetical protein